MRQNLISPMITIIGENCDPLIVPRISNIHVQRKTQAAH